MFYIVIIPHQFAPKLYSFYSDQHFINTVNSDPRYKLSNTFQQALEAFTEDAHRFLLIRNPDDIQAVIQYTGHQETEVRALASKIEV